MYSSKNSKETAALKHPYLTIRVIILIKIPPVEKYENKSVGTNPSVNIKFSPIIRYVFITHVCQ